ncbi:MAG: hypothetical protein GY866_25745 [Proteobacteria bacterium]|nr:hypothetical protein [Pseudomonadota bacterium]
MPGRDGTGPFGTGPLNKQSRKSKGGNRPRRNRNSAGNCQGRGDAKSSRNPTPGRRYSDGMAPDSLTGIPALVLSLATVALPAFFRLREWIRDSKEPDRLDRGKSEAETITVEPAPRLLEKEDSRR